MIGKVKGYEIKKNKDSENDSLLLQVEVQDPEDIQTVEFFQGQGEQSRPLEDSTVWINEAGPSYKIATAVNDAIQPETMADGDKFLYAVSANGIESIIKLFADGSIKLESTTAGVNVGNLELDTKFTMMSGTDNAVKFSELKTAYNQLKDDFDALVTVFNAHVHVPGDPTVTPGSQSTGDIDPAKVEEVLLP